jgi:hypothetical protein
VVKYHDVSEKNTAFIFEVTEMTQLEAEAIQRKKMFDRDWPNSMKPAYITHTLKGEAVDSYKMPQNLATTQHRNPK